MDCQPRIEAGLADLRNVIDDSYVLELSAAGRRLFRLYAVVLDSRPPAGAMSRLGPTTPTAPTPATCGDDEASSLRSTLENYLFSVVQAQRAVLEALAPTDFELRQRLTLCSHGEALDELISLADAELVLILDIDCVPMTLAAIPELAGAGAGRAASPAGAQCANHITNDSWCRRLLPGDQPLALGAARSACSLRSTGPRRYWRGADLSVRGNQRALLARHGCCFPRGPAGTSHPAAPHSASIPRWRCLPAHLQHPLITIKTVLHPLMPRNPRWQDVKGALN